MDYYAATKKLHYANDLSSLEHFLFGSFSTTVKGILTTKYRRLNAVVVQFLNVYITIIELSE